MKATNVNLDEQAGQSVSTSPGAPSTRLAKLTGIGSVVVALLASQHHLLHMLILLLTLGMAGMSGMSMSGYPPFVRQGMLVMSVVMVGVTLWQMRTWRNNRAMVLLGGVSIVLTLGLIVWSIMQYGW